MSDDARARLARLEAQGWECDTSARRGVVLCRVSQYGSGPDIASGDDLTAAISKAEALDRGRRQRLVSPAPVYTRPPVETVPKVPVTEGLETDPR